MPEDYLYLDTRRLDSYTQQIGSPKTLEKVPVWKAGLSLAGPEASATQDVLQRDLTTPEKIERLLVYLKKQDKLGTGRFRDESYFNSQQRFRLEVCEAAEVFIPPAEPEDLISESDVRGAAQELSMGSPAGPGRRGRLGPSAAREPEADQIAWQLRKRELERAQARLRGFKGIRLWISQENRTSLFLLLDFRRSDEEAFTHVSTYTALFGAFEELDGINKTRLSRAIENARYGGSEGARQFIRDPIAFLESQGAEIVHWRKIKSLYQVRQVFYDKTSKDMATLVTVGYPIFISDSESFGSTVID